MIFSQTLQDKGEGSDSSKPQKLSRPLLVRGTTSSPTLQGRGKIRNSDKTIGQQLLPRAPRNPPDNNAHLRLLVRRYKVRCTQLPAFSIACCMAPHLARSLHQGLPKLMRSGQQICLAKSAALSSLLLVLKRLAARLLCAVCEELHHRPAEWPEKPLRVWA